MELQTILDSMVRAEEAASQVVLHAHRIISENKTGARDVVTEYDKKVQALLISMLQEAVPGAEFIAEELPRQGSPEAAQLFIIDPIDGTMNFVKGFNHSCISAAYAENGVVKAAAVCNPYLREQFTAIKGGGARLNGKPIHAPDCELKDSVVCFGTSPYKPAATEDTFRVARMAFEHSLDVRREGSAELDLCSVAAGRAGLYFEMSLSVWDYAAGTLIAEEAGALCSTMEGTPLPYNISKPTVLAGTPSAVREFLQILRQI